VSVLNSTASDTDILQQIRAGESWAFVMLVERHQPVLYAYANAMTGMGAAELAPLITQAFGLVHGALGRLSDPAAFLPFSLRALRRVMGNERVAQAAPAGDVPEPELSFAEVPPALLERQLRSRLLRLPQDQRDAWILRYVCGVPPAQAPVARGATAGEFEELARAACEALERASEKAE
jgi:DNA-directed RNA polymerase specialized sigma24 family protein